MTPRKLRLSLREPELGVSQFVGAHEGRHQEQAQIAHLPDLLPYLLHLPVELASQRLDVRLLSVLAAVRRRRGRSPSHSPSPCSVLLGGEGGAHLGGGAAERCGRLGGHLFERPFAGAGGVQLGGEAGAVAFEEVIFLRIVG